MQCKLNYITINLSSDPGTLDLMTRKRELLIYFSLVMLLLSLIIQAMPHSLGTVKYYIQIVNCYKLQIHDANFTKWMFASPMGAIPFMRESRWRKCCVELFNGTTAYGEVVTGKLVFEGTVELHCSYMKGYTIYRKVPGGYLYEDIPISCFSKAFNLILIKSAERTIKISSGEDPLRINLIRLEEEYNLPSEYEIVASGVIVYYVRTELAKVSNEENVTFFYLRVRKINENERDITMKYYWPIIIVSIKALDPMFTSIKTLSSPLLATSLISLLTYIGLSKVKTTKYSRMFQG